MQDSAQKPAGREQGRAGRRRLLQMGAATALAAPSFFIGRGPTRAQSRGRVTFGFAVAQTGPYADEGADQLRAFELAVQHLNGQGDGGMLATMQPSALTGDGVLGRRVDS